MGQKRAEIPTYYVQHNQNGLSMYMYMVGLLIQSCGKALVKLGL